MTCQPLRRSGSSANITYYGEPQPEGPGRVWCDVLRHGIERVGDGWRSKPIPDFYVTVYVTGRGEVGRTTYTPKTRPRQPELPARTVTRLVREVLEGVR